MENYTITEFNAITGLETHRKMTDEEIAELPPFNELETPAE
jgi:hypothetical protein